MKETMLKVISELMKNSRKSDRALAKTIGVSQPTISRTIKKLEEEGYIREYTAIPDFAKLGYQIMAFTFVKLRHGLKPEEIEEARETTKTDMVRIAPTEIILFERGIGLEYDGVIVSLHKDYADFIELKGKTRNYPFLDHSRCESFMINLNDEVHYRYLTLSTLADDVLER